MDKICIGILGAADIAKRKFLPSLLKSSTAVFAGVASNSSWDKAKKLAYDFGGKAYKSYEEILEDKEIDAVYIPLPPSFHAKWIKNALEAGKHVLSEKPFTTSYADTKSIISLSEKKNLAVFENYGFIYSDQIRLMKKLLAEGAIGDLRQIEASFGFPKRDASDFRNVKSLGGGALLDAGGYTIRAATIFLGDNPVVRASVLREASDHDVDFWDSILMTDDNNISALLSFGMDNLYRCTVRLWGSTGEMYTDRAFTAPSDLKVPITVKTSDGETVYRSEASDQFLLSIENFTAEIRDSSLRADTNSAVLLQSRLADQAMHG